ncbi:MAG TPA: peptide-methionine (S)-S-oxide reductase MsrA [Longimicrobiales bacterium]|nr:peptide-methionine (S)-S-oxide reductase MsrA [Longimicrobiales bacterium]
MAKATFGGGCFWCLEAVFTELRGVQRVESGYSGGTVERPSYQQVCAGTTGHAEVVQIEHDAGLISFRDLLDVFFTIHDPTTPDRQGADVGSQYRSIVLYHDDDQKREIEAAVAQLLADGVWHHIVTQVQPLQTFWPAEVYHRDYYRRNPDQAYCRAVIAPKVAKLRRHHLDKLRAEA